MKYQLLFLLCFFIAGTNLAQVNDFSHKIQSKYFETKRTIKIHLPKNFNKTERLPVIFILDAQWDTYFKLTTSIIDYLIETNEFPRCIIVGVNSENRQYEFTPEPINEDWKVPNLGGAKLLESHIENEVVHFLEQVYNIESYRIVIGHSLGATFVLNSSVDRPNLFNAYIAISPNLQIDNEEIINKIQRYGKELSNSKKFIYTSLGTDGNPESIFLESAKKLDLIMMEHNSSTLNWNFSIYQGINHATSPTESIHNSLLLLAKKWRIPEIEKIEIACSPNVVDQFNNFYKKLSNWTGYTVLPSQTDLYNFAAFLEERAQFNDAINLYKSALELYPSESKLFYCIAIDLKKLDMKKEAELYLLRALKVLKDEKIENPKDKKFFKNLYKRNLENLNQK